LGDGLVVYPQQTSATISGKHLFMLMGLVRLSPSRPLKTGTAGAEPSAPVKAGSLDVTSRVEGNGMNMEIMMKKILTAALLASVATSAFASDLPSRKAPPVMAPAYAPLAYSWTGFYVGVNGGYGIGDFSGFGSTEFGRPSGGLIGATAGYNYQIGQFVTGIEANLDWADITKSQTFGDGSTSKATLNSLGNVLARFGFAYDRALFYVAGGYAGGNLTGSFNDTVTGLNYSNSGWRSGYAMGGGIEYALTNNISIKAQYIYSQLGNKTYFAGTPDAVKTGLAVNTLTTGINYKF
jgi:outer membrane immunogenic protein